MSGWKTVTADPNSPAARRMRQAEVEAARLAPVGSRLDFFADACRGAAVLNLGCVDQVPDGYQIAPLHRRLDAVAARCVGVDIDGAGVAALRREGFEVLRADASDPDFPSHVPAPFDVVVAGELIEHLVDAGGMLTNARRVLAPHGRVLLSAPNPYWMAISVGETLGWYSGNVDHVADYRPYGMAELAARTGFVLAGWRGEASPAFWGGNRRPFHWLARAVSVFNRRSIADCGSIIYELTPTGPP
jgi:SAM-dependent methyltransferase